MSHKTARFVLFASAMTAASGAFAAVVVPLGSSLDDALGRGSLLALAAAGLVVGIAIVRRKQGR
jgi:hypothetical protein